MAVRLFLILAFALVLSATGTSSADGDAIVVTVEHERESPADLDEAQVVMGEVVLEGDDHAVTRTSPESTAPVPPFRHGVFRPPRAAFD